MPTILKGYAFPALKVQASKKWLGGDIAGTLKQTAAFLKAQGKIGSVLPDYSKFVNVSYIKAAMK